jgi:hypothetical protein
MLFALAAMTRPDGVVFLTAVILWGLIEYALSGSVRRRKLLRHLTITIAAFVAVFGPYFVWRWAYYEDILPNTFYAKTGGGPAQVLFGVNYVVNYVSSRTGLWLLLGSRAYDTQQFVIFPFAELIALFILVPSALVTAWYWVRLRMRFIGLLLSTAGAYLFYVILVGGDWMAGFRFIVPILPIGALIMGCFVANNPFNRIGEQPSRLYTAFMSCLVVLTIMSGIYMENLFIRSQLPWLQPWHKHGTLHPSGPYYEVAQWLKQNADNNDVVAIGEAGLIPYYAETRIIDMFGLIDKHIARQPGLLHIKGDAKYVLERKPDYIVLVALCDTDGNVRYAQPPYQALLGSGEFNNQYRLTTIVARNHAGDLEDRFLIYSRVG